MNGPTPHEEKVMWQALTWLSYLAIFAICVLCLWGFVQLAGFFKAILIPIAIAGIAAYMFNPIIDYAVNTLKAQRTAAILGFMSVCLLLLTLFIVFIGPPLYTEVVNSIDSFPQFIDSLKNDYQNFLSDHPGLSEHLANFQGNIKNQIKDFEGNFGESLGKNLEGAFGIIGIALGLVITPVLFFYFLRDRKSIENNWREFIPLRSGKTKNEIIIILEEIDRYLKVFFRGQIIVAACIGVLTAIGLFAIGLKYAIIIGLISGLLSIIPYLGIISSIIPAMMVGFFQQGGGWTMVFLVVAVFMIVQAIEATFITPRVMGDKTGLHPATVIIAILAWTTVLGGFLGPLLAVPLTATLKVLMYRYIWKQPTSTPDPHK
jgi:predicted PurR-regulated permease PerM